MSEARTSPTKTEREDIRLRNFIFHHWFYPFPGRSAFPPRERMSRPAPGYCRYVEFTEEEIEQLKEEHDA